MACTRDDVEIVKMLIEDGKEEDLSSRDLDGRTPLMYACLHKNPAVVKFLTQLGKQSSTTVGKKTVDVNFSTSSGFVIMYQCTGYLLRYKSCNKFYLWQICHNLNK